MMNIMNVVMRCFTYIEQKFRKIILKYPEQYLWSYEKFRNRVGVEENIYVTTFSKTQELE